MKRVCVFCGSSPGIRPEYIQAAKELGDTLASRDVGLVLGGARRENDYLQHWRAR